MLQQLRHLLQCVLTCVCLMAHMLSRWCRPVGVHRSAKTGDFAEVYIGNVSDAGEWEAIPVLYPRDCGKKLSLIHVAVCCIEVVGANQHCEHFGRLFRELPIQYPPPQVPNLVPCMAQANLYGKTLPE